MHAVLLVLEAHERTVVALDIEVLQGREAVNHPDLEFWVGGVARGVIVLSEECDSILHVSGWFDGLQDSKGAGIAALIAGAGWA